MCQPAEAIADASRRAVSNNAQPPVEDGDKNPLAPQKSSARGTCVPLIEKNLRSPCHHWYPAPDHWDLHSFPTTPQEALPMQQREETCTGQPTWHLLSGICFRSTGCFSHFSPCGSMGLALRKQLTTHRHCRCLLWHIAATVVTWVLVVTEICFLSSVVWCQTL